MDTKVHISIFRERLFKAMDDKGFTQERLAEAIGRSNQSVGDWARGTDDKTPSLRDCLLICEALGVGLDFLLGYTDEPNNKVAYIHEHTGLTKENVKKLIEYNKSAIKPIDYSKESKPISINKLKAINAILSNEHGLQILEDMAAYATIDINLLFIDTPYGAHGGIDKEFVIIGSGDEDEVYLKKADIPKVFLTSIMTELEKWRESERKKKTKAARKKAKGG